MQRIPVDLADPNLKAHAFLVTRWHGEPVNSAPQEHDDLRWFGIQDLRGLALAHPSYEDWLPALMSNGGEGPS